MKGKPTASIRNRFVHLNHKRRKTPRFRKSGQGAQRRALNVGMRIVEGPGKDRPTRPVAEQTKTPGATRTKQEVQAAEEVERPIGN
jgi:hypothetical protein